MQTSYFANLRNIKYPLSISRFPPRWYAGAKFPQLAPKTELLLAYNEGRVDPAQYAYIFQQTVLNKFDPVEIYERLTKYYTKDVTLLCFETPNEFCHRRLVAEWLSKANGVEIPELK